MSNPEGEQFLKDHVTTEAEQADVDLIPSSNLSDLRFNTILRSTLPFKKSVKVTGTSQALILYRQ